MFWGSLSRFLTDFLFSLSKPQNHSNLPDSFFRAGSVNEISFSGVLKSPKASPLSVSSLPTSLDGFKMVGIDWRILSSRDDSHASGFVCSFNITLREFP